MQYFKITAIDGQHDEHRCNDNDEVEEYLNEHSPDWEEAHILHYLRIGNTYEDVKYILRKDGGVIMWLPE